MATQVEVAEALDSCHDCHETIRVLPIMWLESGYKLMTSLTTIAREFGITVEASDNLESVLRAMGDELRSTRLRKELARSPLPALLLQILQEASLPERTEALRVTANLCIDTTESRLILLEVDIIPTIVRGLNESFSKSTPIFQQIRWTLVTLGAMLNMQMECVPVKHALFDCGAIPQTFNALAILLSMSLKDHETCAISVQAMEWGLRLQDDILTDENAKSYTWTPPDAEVLFRVLQAWSELDSGSMLDTEKMEHRMSIIESACNILDHEAKNSTFCAAIASSQNLDILGLLLHMVHDTMFPYQDSHNLCDYEEPLVSDAYHVFGHLKKVATHTIVALAGEDANMDRLCPLSDGHLAKPNPLLETLYIWTSDLHGDSKQAVCAILALGNLARGHTRSVELASQPQLLYFMLQQMLHHPNDMHIAYAVIRATGNFAIPDQNKSLVVSSGIVTEACMYLAPEHDIKSPIQSGVLVLLKNLTSSPSKPIIALDLLGCMPHASKHVLEPLKDLWHRTDDTTTRLRIARIYVALLRSVFGSDKSEHSMHRLSQESLISSSEINAAYERAEQKLCSPPVVEALCHLLCYSKQHVVLQNEGVLGLIFLIRSAHADAFITDTIFKVSSSPIGGDFSSVTETLLYILQTAPAQVASNAYVLWLLLEKDERASEWRTRMEDAWSKCAQQM